MGHFTALANHWLYDKLRDAWSITGRMSDEVAAYAGRLWVHDARSGLMSLSAVMFLLFVAEIAVQARFGLGRVHLYTFGLLAMLAAHIMFSARAVQDTRSIYVLGTALLVVSSTAIMLLAHQLGTFTFTLFSCVALLFVVVPILPWGLREASVVTGLVYLTFTASAVSGGTRFDPQTLWALQFIMIGAGLISLASVARNTVIRKADFRARFELEKAHNKLLQLSHIDPLTQAYNRRFLTDHFSQNLERWQSERCLCHFAYIDIDNFKPINDTFGHDFGDQVLRALSKSFRAVVRKRGFLVRMGGDEFALLFHHDDPRSLIAEGRRIMLRSLTGRGQPVDVSVGLVTIPSDAKFAVEQIMRLADDALYDAKERKDRFTGQLNMVICEMQDKSVNPQQPKLEETTA